MLNLHWHHLLSCAYGPVLPLVFLLLLWDPGKRAGGLSSVGLSSSPCGIPRKDVPVQEPKCGKAANPFQITALQIVNTPCLFNLQAMFATGEHYKTSHLSLPRASRSRDRPTCEHKGSYLNGHQPWFGPTSP